MPGLVPAVGCGTLPRTCIHMLATFPLILPQPFSGPRCTSRANANCTIEVEDQTAEPPMVIRNVSTYNSHDF